MDQRVPTSLEVIARGRQLAGRVLLDKHASSAMRDAARVFLREADKAATAGALAQRQRGPIRIRSSLGR